MRNFNKKDGVAFLSYFELLRMDRRIIAGADLDKMKKKLRNEYPHSQIMVDERFSHLDDEQIDDLVEEIVNSFFYLYRSSKNVVAYIT